MKFVEINFVTFKANLLIQFNDHKSSMSVFELF